MFKLFKKPLQEAQIPLIPPKRIMSKPNFA